ncbi:restriction endonuclease subunit S [Vibrio fluvialis]|nr:restriction endonuclease subunit S [Vibrio fluvialis]
MTALSETKRYQAYPEYKDSGVEWVGNIPSHWQVTPIKYLATLNPRKSAIDSSLLNKECNFLPMEKLKLNSIVLDEKRLVSDVYDGYTYFEDGDVLMAKVTPCFENKNIAVASGLLNGVGFGSSEIYVLRSNEKTDNRFLYYRLQEDSFMDIATAAMTGAGGLKRVPSEVVNGYSLGTPEVEEQTQIANFLDHETAKIDTLIEKQQQLIKLLKEKRQAVISHAVTKGLNPQAPMKDSGVEWLGEVPEHWAVKPLRFLGTCQNGINIGADFFGSGYPFVSYGDAYRNYSLPTSVSGLVRSTEKDREAYSLLRGDVLFTRTSETIEEIGLSSACLEPIPEATFAGFLIRFRPAELTLHPEFSKFSFRNQLIRAFFVKEMNLVTRASLSQELLKKLPVPCPPLEEQVKIAEFLCVQEERFQRLFDNAEKAVLLLKERRTALISAAVTGKIDVRNWQAPTSQDQALEHTA